MVAQEKSETTHTISKKRHEMKKTANTSLSQERVADHVRIPPPLVFVALAALGIGLHRAYPAPLPLPSWLALVIGLLIITLGVALLVASVQKLRRARTDHTGLKPTTTIVKYGPFRWSRNPIYLAVLLWLAGLSFVVNTIWLLVLTPLLFLFFRWVVANEERYLERRFGEEYLNYKSCVRRWI